MSDFKFKPGDKARYRTQSKPECIIDVAVVGSTLGGKPIVEASGTVWAADASRLLPPVQEQQEVVRWVYLWSDGQVTGPDEKCSFENGHAFGRNTLVARTRVVLTPGRFDTEDSPSEYDRGYADALSAAECAVMQKDYDGFVDAARVAYKCARDAIRALRRPS